MGIRLSVVHLFSNVLPILGNLSAKKVLTLGVQDCHFTYDQIVGFLRRHNVPHVPLPEDEIRLTSGFKWALPSTIKQYSNYIHQDTLLRLLGFGRGNICSMDVSDYEGADIVHDLNVPVDDALYEKFDLIFDSGTIEHIFSIKDSFFNLSRMCKVGGLIVNFDPVDYINHGFINLNAEIFREFYCANGFEEVELKYIAIPQHPKLVDKYYLEFEPEKYFYPLQPYYSTGVYSVFKKVRKSQLRIPNQGSYKGNFENSGTPEPQPLPRRSHTYLGRLLMDELRDFVEKYFFLSVVIRGYRSIRRGKRVRL